MYISTKETNKDETFVLLYVFIVYHVRCTLQGLRIQDSREISPWDILEGVKNAGPLMLSWFGAVRMKRKPLKYMEQRRLVHFHTHQKRFREMGRRYFVSLPDPAPPTDPIATDVPSEIDTPTVATSKLPGSSVVPTGQDLSSQRPNTAASGNPALSSVSVSKPYAPVAPMQPAGMAPRQQMMRPPQQQPQAAGMWPQGGAAMPKTQVLQRQQILQKIQKNQLENQRIVATYSGMQRPAPYPMMPHLQQRPSQMAGYNPAMRSQRLTIPAMMTPEQRHLYIQRLRFRQHQQQAAINQMGAPQYNAQYQQPMGHPQMVQAGPPMQVHQPMQPGYNQQMMVQQQYPPHQPGAPMNQPMY